VKVTVFEASSQLGGRARRVTHQGVALDNGQHLLIGAYRDTIALIGKVHDGRPPLIRTPLRLHVGRDLELRCPAWPAPLHLAAGLLGASGLSWGDRMAAASMMLRLRMGGYAVPPGWSVARLLDHYRQTPRLRRLLWEPLCIAALNTGTAAADAQVFATVLGHSLGGAADAADLVYPATDLGALFPDAAAQRIEQLGGEILPGTAVRHVSRDTQGFRLELDGTSPRRADHVVWATDPARFAGPTADLPELSQTREQISTFAYLPIVTVYLHYPDPLPFDGPMLGDADGPVQWFFDRGQLCGQTGWVGAVCSAAEAWRGVDRDAIGALAANQVKTLFRTGQTPDQTLVITEKRATFACTPGLVRPTRRTALPRFHLAGDYTASPYPATLEAAVQSGLECAAAILEDA
jgi:squalene-associated FAD-dependent desaturase